MVTEEKPRLNPGDAVAVAERDIFRPGERAMMAQRKDYEIDQTDVIAEIGDMTLVKRHKAFETFTYTSDGETFIFDVAGIRRAIVDDRVPCAMYEATLTEVFYQRVLTQNGVEENRVNELTGHDLKRPGIMIMWPDESSTLIDGNHRLVKRYRLGLRSFRYVAVPITECIDYVCEPGGQDKFFENQH